MKHFAPLLSLLIITFTSLGAHAANHGDTAPYAGLLSDYVSLGERNGITSAMVAYGKWATDPRHTQAIETLKAIEPSGLSGKGELAFWINAYNLLTIDLIITNTENRSIRRIGGVFGNPWKGTSWRIGVKDYTLDAIEHEILRKRGEPRIHFAINCASLSCPDLRAEPYAAATLEAQLSEQTIAFLSNTAKGVRETKQGLRISKIFDWFKQDFGGEQASIDYIYRHNPELSEHGTLDGYLEYDWSLNGHWD